MNNMTGSSHEKNINILYDGFYGQAKSSQQLPNTEHGPMVNMF
jgi:hypothetical protein